MSLTDFIYYNAEEPFGMGGPFIGNLEFKGKKIDGKFLVDGEILNDKKDKIIFLRLTDIRKKKRFLVFSSIREFQILVFDKVNKKFYQSIDKFESLSIEKMENDIITYHLAFHNSSNEFSRVIEFNLDNFERIELI